MASAGDSPLLELVELAATRPGGDLLGPLSLQLMPQTATALAGPAGAGRDDLVDLISGCTTPRAGSIRFTGRDIAALDRAQRIRLGVVRCRFDLPPPALRSLADWLLLARRLLDLPPAALWRRSLGRPDRTTHTDLLAVLEFTGLRNAIDEPPARLPPARYRLALLAVALIQRPRLLVLERPFAGQLAGQREEWTERFLRLRRDGLTLLLVDDCPAWLAGFCDRMAVMAQGRIIAAGPPETVGDQAAAIEAFTGQPSLD